MYLGFFASQSSRGTILRLFKDEKPLTFCGLIAIVALGLGISEALGTRPWLATFYFTFTTVSVFTGLILNSISQRTRELTQIIEKAVGVDLSRHVEESVKLTKKALG